MAFDFSTAKLASEMDHSASSGQGTSIEQQQAEASTRLQAAPGQITQGVVASAVGAPVDTVNTVLKAFNLGTAKPVGGSEWLGEKMGANTESTAFNIGTALPVNPQAASLGGAKMLGLAGALASKGGKTSVVVKSLTLGEKLNALKPTDTFGRSDQAGLYVRTHLPEVDDSVLAGVKLNRVPPKIDPKKLVEIDPADPRLVSLQGAVRKDKLLGLVNTYDSRKEVPDPVTIINAKGKLVVMDGNTRLTAAALRGDKAVPVLFLN
jgi:hypothetical protein